MDFYSLISIVSAKPRKYKNWVKKFMQRIKKKGLKQAFKDVYIYLKQQRIMKIFAKSGVISTHTMKNLPLTKVINLKTINSNYKLYLEEPQTMIKKFKHDYNFKNKPKVQLIHNGFIAPHSGGGVYDKEGNFVTYHKRKINENIERDICSVSFKDKLEDDSETVVFGGVIFNHFGHFLLESLSRMWWLIENPTCMHKFVFISADDHPINFDALEFFEILGLERNRIEVVKKPTRFNAIIVPEQTIFISDGFKPEAIKVYDALRSAVSPANYKKVYFTRTKLWRIDAVNEEYFENYFRSKGYTIIAPETLSIREQIAVMAGVEEYACISGSLHHHILLCREGVKVVILNRTSYMFEVGFIPVSAWVNQLIKANCIYIDVFMNFLPFGNQSTYLVGPTASWLAYKKDIFNEDATSDDSLTTHKIIEYISTWCHFMATIPVNREQHAHTTFADFVIQYHKYVYGIELEDTVKKRLYEIYPKHK